ncbi:C4-dicarboxylate ABC transporter [Deltaproteobacteria bacterium]|nr:C4-dicarboxylate ABC transporter [Deltaproteobacteria bacterium]
MNAVETGINKAAAEKILNKYERESVYRRLDGALAKVVFCLALAWVFFQLYTAFFGTFPTTLQRAPHVGFALTLIFLLYPLNKSRQSHGVPWYDYLLAAASVVVCMYHIVFFKELEVSGAVFDANDMYISIAAVLLIMEGTRRVAGPPVVILAAFFLAYAYLGEYFPGFLAHRGFSIKRLVTYEWLGTEGILGTPVYVSSTFIFLFLIFATFLKKSGVGDWMTGIAMGTCGSYMGGPAKAAVIASALQGTISGSSVANVVSTGPITIPLMKKSGYRKEFAGAVEAAASTGGQLMPPVMGAAAFIMTEYVGVSYSTIAFAAGIPAILYFTGIFTNVHFEAKKHGLMGIPKNELPQWKSLFKNGWYMIAPIVTIVGMLIAGYTPMRAALFGLFACLAVWGIEILRLTRAFDVRSFCSRIIYAMDEGARSAISVAIICACVGIIVGVISLSGLGLKMAGGIIDLAGGSLLLTMVFTMLCSLVLGMGVPTTANYIIQATISAPAMIALGVQPIAAHLFVFYFGLVADITPPVALAAFAGAGIAEANPVKTGIEAFRLGFAAYLVPFIFALNPVLVLVQPEGVSGALFVILLVKAILTAFAGMVGIATGFTGYFFTRCNSLERVVLVAAGVMLVDPGTLTDMVGFCMMAVIYLFQRYRSSIGMAELLAPVPKDGEKSAG